MGIMSAIARHCAFYDFRPGTAGATSSTGVSSGLAPAEAGAGHQAIRSGFARAHGQVALFDHPASRKTARAFYGFCRHKCLSMGSVTDGIFRTENVKAHSPMPTRKAWAKGPDPANFRPRVRGRSVRCGVRSCGRRLAEMKPEIVKGMEQALRDAAKVAFT